MPSSNFAVRAALGIRSTVIIVGGWSLLSASVYAQQPKPTPTPGSPHGPAISLVEPQNGGTVPRDRPIAVFRFATADSGDSISARSFAVSVDGNDRSALFNATREMAVGFLVGDGAADSLALELGVHQVHARICTVRGSCGELEASVTMIAAESPPSASGEPDSTAQSSSPVSLIRMLLELVLALARKLIAQ